jgi:putative ABC transport system permease protein
MRLIRAIRSPLFWRMLRRSLLLRSGHTTTALLALTIIAATATAMGTLYLDLDAKLHKEFRAYGANIVVIAKEGQELTETSLARIRSVLPSDALAVPFGYAVARSADGTTVIVSGTDLNLAKQLNRWWSVSNWPSAAREALFGQRVLRSLGSQQSPYSLRFGDKSMDLFLVGTLKTGSDEENRIYLSLSDFRRWTGLGASTLEISVPGSRAQIDAVIRQVQNVALTSDVRPIRQIVEAEAGVISKTKLLMNTALVLIGITVVLCVLATLTTSVLERRRDFAVMKALGSSQRTVSLLFAGEAAFLGGAAAFLGYALGLGVAVWIEQANFHSSAQPRFLVFPLVVIGTVVIALLAALFPLTKLQGLEPAGILKGE